MINLAFHNPFIIKIEYVQLEKINFKIIKPKCRYKIFESISTYFSQNIK